MEARKTTSSRRAEADPATNGRVEMKIRHFLDARTQNELHMHVEYEEPSVLVGRLCDDDEDSSYRTLLVEVEPGSGIWERK
jgi:hypothetical protein